MNQAAIVGRLTRDPELKMTNSGTAYCKFCLAVNRPFDTDKKADFINCVAWKGQAENLAKYMRKGYQVGVTGSIQTGSYQKNGVTNYTTEIMANQIIFLESRKTAESHESTYQYQQSEPAKSFYEPSQTPQESKSPQDFISNDDLPF